MLFMRAGCGTNRRRLVGGEGRSGVAPERGPHAAVWRGVVSGMSAGAALRFNVPSRRRGPTLPGGRRSPWEESDGDPKMTWRPSLTALFLMALRSAGTSIVGMLRTRMGDSFKAGEGGDPGGGLVTPLLFSSNGPWVAKPICLRVICRAFWRGIGTDPERSSGYIEAWWAGSDTGLKGRRGHCSD